MKVDERILNYQIAGNLPKPAQESAEQVRQKQSDENRAEGQRGGVAQDTVVEISRASKEAEMIRAAVASDSEAREEKVAAVKERVESGNYKIDYEGVADKLVDSFMDEIS
jgi:negative regulator of flagellin synthesis FlgM